jgi:hypothetical protein
MFSIVAQRSSRCPYTLLLIELPTPVVSETKLDSTFKDSLFEVDGYKLQRRDRTDDSVLKICQNTGHFVGHVVEKK